jgi:hypothetical protein
LHTPWQQKVFTKLLDLQYKIIYKKGVDNIAADALSRKPDADGRCMTLSSYQPQWLDQLQDSYASDDHAKELISKLTVVDSTES